MEEYVVEQEPKKSGLCIASLVCGIVATLGCCNPFYLVSLAAVVTGIIGLATGKQPKGMAIAGLVLGIVSACIWVVLDIILAIFTGGLSFFV